ncbi:NAD(P)-binding domain-containing protein [Bifidobacterium sp. ESL0784]|uniref:NADPH-dependent F420 reductase n=1 Tax=Bifidobacterium sp. ESL0784 TaxID=2983231 RepID=UPI0023F9B83B|nr:NAD(P)-binding domain-containing protein [Bifidobacterium sp. ESL0784]MDF7641687.1 NAD(P)-binding domain-containing protein [Bifidobacterium sp. ESL0784]
MTSITVFGSGHIGAAVAGIGVAAGADVQVIDRDKAKAAAIPGVTPSVWSEEITGDIVILALPYPAEASVVDEYGTQLAGKIVVDPSNPVDFSTMDLALPQGVHSAAEELAAKLPDSKVIKAFNTDFAATLASGTNDGAPTTVMAASDSEDAKKALQAIVEGADLRFVDAGPLKRASYMEGFGALQMVLAMNGGTQWTSGFKVVK